MKPVKAGFVFAILLFVNAALAQWKAQESRVSVELRGLSVVSRDVAWASGTRGTYTRTTDGGKTWQSGVVQGAESLDFRDVEAVDAYRAFLFSIGEQSRIYKTTDGGRHWTLQYSNTTAGVFFDAFAFWDAQNGVAFSDPVNGSFLIITTSDGGKTWKEVPRESMPPPLEGEAAFAASGTCITVQGTSNAWIGTGGGAKARVLRSTDKGRTWAVAETPIAAGSASSGIFSIAFKDAKNGVAVGGDYRNPNQESDNIATTIDGGQTWRLAGRVQPAGYKSCVAYVPDTVAPTMVAVGLSGSGYSTDDGRTWTSIDTTGYNSVAFAGPDAGWAAGSGGRIARFDGLLPGAIRRSGGGSR
ncbi:MAG: YCF48-related protein [Blastocatellia bacterium]|nr:YCF48-related protein [Blastocatellia bacterium]